jgi:UDP-3-O-[3-hydroxymyristoyl] N-acetylglucosamine deacetylase
MVSFILEKRLMSQSGSYSKLNQKKQHTLREAVIVEGVALHSGVAVSLTIQPAAIHHGIVFKRIDVKNHHAVIPAKWNLVSDTRLCTTITNKQGISVSTIEHLMAAFSGCGIDNVTIEVNGPEVPIMDGSSEPFVSIFQSCGVVEQNAARQVLKILKPVEILGDLGECIILTPADEFSIDFEIDFNSMAIKEKSLDISLVNGTFNHVISGARTFGFLEDVDKMRAAGLGLGGSLDNVVVVDGSNILNAGGLRYNDEFVRHKILDCVGDVYLAGGPIMGRIKAFKTGHYFNNKLLRQLFADEEAWEWITLSEEKTQPRCELTSALV